MGLNLETLIGILVILILLILADGVRRMIRERHGRLRMRIDRSLRNRGGADDEEKEYPTELIGRPRVRDRMDDDVDGEDPAPTPPIVMDEAEEPEPPVATRAEQQSLFGGQEADQEPPPVIDEPAVRERAGESRPNVRSHSDRSDNDRSHSDRSDNDRSRGDGSRGDGAGKAGVARDEGRREPRPVSSQPSLEVIVFHLIARRPGRFDGKAMLSLMLESGLRYGDMNIFHRHRDSAGREELQFSVANAVEPGTFDIDAMEGEEFAGITFFLKLPGPSEALGALDRMLAIGRRMAEELEGELKDEQHSVLTPQTMEHLRQRVQEFERRQRVSNGA